MIDDACDRIASRLLKERLQPELVRSAGLPSLVAERCAKHRLESPIHYAELVERDEAELGWLRSQIAVPETWLFRYPASFEYIRRWVGDRSRDWSVDRPLQILSVACANGAEAFSAVVASSSALGIGRAVDGCTSVRAVGIDPNAAAVDAARRGTLGRMALRGEMPAWAADGDAVTVADGVPTVHERIRAQASFLVGAAPESLAAMPAESIDLVFCRNLAIYLDADARQQIGQQLLRILRPQGILFLGHAERPALFGCERSIHGAPGADPAAFAFVHASARLPRVKDEERPENSRISSPQRRDSRRESQRRSPQPTSLAEARRAADEGRLDESRSAALALHAGGSREPSLLHLLGTLALAAGDETEAEQWLRQVVYAVPNHDEALLTMAVLAERRGDLEAGRRLRQRAGRGGGGTP